MPLIQSLYCNGPRVRQTLTGNAPAEFDVNTAAGTHDGLDTTTDSAADTSPCNLNYAVQYQVDTFVGGTVDSVTVNLRAKRLAASTGTVRPTIGGVDRGTPQALTIGFTNFTFVFTTDPATGLPWTTASINAYNASGGWGFRAQIADTSNVTFADAEITVDVAGTPLPSVRLGGYTSYDLGQFDVSQPEAQRPPEEAAAVWRGDRRYQRST